MYSKVVYLIVSCCIACLGCRLYSVVGIVTSRMLQTSSKLVIIAPQALLPGRDVPQPATIEVDRLLGVITAVHRTIDNSRQYDASMEVIRLEDHQVLLPGLIELV